MSKKLYYIDSYLEKFKAIVLACESYREGYSVVLDETAFYPEGGGQPADKGILNGIEVEHVFSKEGKIYHILKKPFKVGESVEGTIQFERRWDYMQQHSGEHILSGIIKAEYGYDNVGFHMSETYMTADFDGELTKEQLIELEIKANQVVFSNVPITTQMYQHKEIQEWTYRSKLDLVGEVRLVTVESCDVCACCGTHLRRTGEVGLIKILAGERHRGGMRLTIVCGRRALQDYQNRVTSISELSSLLSAKPEGVVQSVKKIQAELAEHKQKLAQRTQEMFKYKVDKYSGQSDTVIGIQESELKPDEVRQLCMMMIEKTTAICLVVTPDGEQFKYALGCSKRDIRELCKALNKAFNGRGGGGKDLCQGSVRGEFEDIIRYLEEQVKPLKYK